MIHYARVRDGLRTECNILDSCVYFLTVVARRFFVCSYWRAWFLLRHGMHAQLTNVLSSREFVVRQAAACPCSLSANQEVAVLALDGLDLVSEAQARHKTAPTATAALGRALLGSLLMGCFRKDNESLQITFAGEGPIKGVQVIAESNGYVKGKVGNVLCDLPVRADGKLDVGKAVGPGAFTRRSHALGSGRPQS